MGHLDDGRYAAERELVLKKEYKAVFASCARRADSPTRRPLQKARAQVTPQALSSVLQLRLEAVWWGKEPPEQDDPAPEIFVIIRRV